MYFVMMLFVTLADFGETTYYSVIDSYGRRQARSPREMLSRGRSWKLGSRSNLAKGSQVQREIVVFGEETKRGAEPISERE